MDLIVELKITNIGDWAIIRPLLQRLKIPFVQKIGQKKIEETQLVDDAGAQTLLALQSESPAFVWSPYDSDEAETALLQLLKTN
jgi:hypothetical protein